MKCWFLFWRQEDVLAVTLPGFGSRTWSAKLSLCCYFALSGFFPLGSFFLFAVKKQGITGSRLLLLFKLTINYLHGFLLTDVLMVIFQTVVLFLYLCKENTPSISSQTAKLQRRTQVTPLGVGRGNEHREARLVIWPGTMVRHLLSPDVHFTHRAAFISP